MDPGGAALEKWYERARRYGQTNLTEIDPEVCDLDFWRDYWKKTGVQGIIVNAGGIVAYYPSRFTLHYRAARLGDRDLFGDFVKAGREAGLVILARMDINRAVEELYQERPDWFARKKDGSPFITQGRYQSCLNSGYYREYVPEILREIIEAYHPDGFTDNSWTGIPRTAICYCDNCQKSFHNYSGLDLPGEADYRNPAYRRWIEWSYRCRIDNWDLFNRVCAEYGGEDCLWMGMVNANVVSGHGSFCDLREVARRSKMFMVDHQGRDGNGFEQNSLNGTLLHQLVGWDKIIPESMASYVRGVQAYRRAAAPALELRLWMLEGIAGGLSPWWHIVGGVQEDQRIFEAALPVLQWHRRYEPYLFNRQPVANVGALWSQANVEFSSGLWGREQVEQSWRGINMALTRAGIPWLPINTADLAEQSQGMDLLILPETALLTEADEAALEDFAARGGSLLVLGAAGVLGPGGERRRSSRLEGLLGLRLSAGEHEGTKPPGSWENPVFHNYLRIEDPAHPVFAPFTETATLPLGGVARELSPAGGNRLKVLATLIPSFPIYPPEFAWTGTPRTDKPVLTEYPLPGGGKGIYAAWDLDAVYGRAALPDHGDLLGGLVTYLLGEKIPVKVDAEAYIDCKVYRQKDRLIVHLVNPNHTGFDQGYAEKNLPVGPVKLRFQLPDFHPSRVTATEDGIHAELRPEGTGCSLTLDRLLIHQLLILE
jgi:hypothetical protein